MIALPEDVTLFSIPRNAEEQARLVRLTRELAADRIDGEWWKVDAAKRLREKEDDHHWRWRQIVGSHRNDGSWESLAVESASGAIEGAIVYRIDALSQIDPGEGTVYGDRLAAAPRNREWLVKAPCYRGVGTILLLAAVRHSHSLGLGGRVSLTSLPSERTRGFYTRRGFLGRFEHGDGMVDYELPSARAVARLEEEEYF